MAQEGPVGQVGQPVVMRHVRDARLDAALLGDVLVCRNAAAVGQRTDRVRDRAAVGELVERIGWRDRPVDP